MILLVLQLLCVTIFMVICLDQPIVIKFGENSVRIEQEEQVDREVEEQREEGRGEK